MNDRFKFRAWNESLKTYSYFDSEPCVQIGDNAYQHGLLFPIIGKVYLCGYKEIEQCTGLKDMTGCLIYEGDILGSMDSSDKYKVIWADGGFMLEKGTTAYDALCSLFVEEKYLEIIGTIHDVPNTLDTTT